ncbi:YccF domain-containing protein [bacterium]|nr:MAG: YccF domain-containing protein [bacterium]
MRTLGNILWIVFGGGLVLAAEYVLGGILLCLTVIGIPFGYQSIRLGLVALFPFGAQIREHSGDKTSLQLIMNILWLFTAGLVIALTHLFFALLCFVTVIGIPFAKQHMKLANLGLMPFGKEIH